MTLNLGWQYRRHLDLNCQSDDSQFNTKYEIHKYIHRNNNLWSERGLTYMANIRDMEPLLES
jgi:hypothetical protein